MAGGTATEAVAQGGAGYFVMNGQITEASSFFLHLLNCLLNPGLTIALFSISNLDTAHHGVVYVEMADLSCG